MASFLQRRRSTTFKHLLQNLSGNPNSSLIALLHLKSLHPTHSPTKPTNPNSPLPFLHPFSFSPRSFSTENPKSFNPSFLQKNSIFTSSLTSQSPFPENPTIPNPYFPTPIKSPIPHPALRRFSSSSPESQPPDLQHQEITGPTVERDVSALANETRQALESLRRSVYDLSSALALLGVAHLGLGTWIAYAVRPPTEISVQGLAAFAFPFSLAFLMRRALKPVIFFQKMEDQGRLQILTLALQVSKSLRLLFVRTRVVCIFCVVGVSAGSMVILWMH